MASPTKAQRARDALDVYRFVWRSDRSIVLGLKQAVKVWQRRPRSAIGRRAFGLDPLAQ